jgi:hypothetical protein
MLKTNLSNLDAINSVYVTGIQGGIGYSSEISKWLGYEGQLVYINKNNRIVRNAFFTDVYREIKSSYLQVPLLFHFKVDISKNIQGHIGVGGFVGYWLSGRLSASFPNILAPKEFNDEVVYENIYQIVSRHNIQEPYSFNDTDKRIEYGTALGVGLTYYLSDKYGLLCRFRNYTSLSDIQKKYQTDQTKKMNRTMSISMGALISIY